MDKRGISAIVATVLIILITVAAVTIIWAAVIPMINNLSFQNLEGRVSVVLSDGYTSYDASNGLASVQLKTDAGSESLTNARIVFHLVGGDSISTIVEAPVQNSKKIYYFNLSEFGVPEGVAVAGIFTQDEDTSEGDVSSSIGFAEGTISEGVSVREITDEIVSIPKNNNENEGENNESEEQQNETNEESNETNETNEITNYFSVYPVSYSSIYVKATSYYNTNFAPHYVMFPSTSLTGGANGASWISNAGQSNNQRLHVDLGGAVDIFRIYYENMHLSGTEADRGAKDFTFWGSNDASAFSNLAYSSDTGWTELNVSQEYFDQHVASDVSDPKYIEVSSNVPYRYYAFKIENNYGDLSFVGLRRIELQSGS